MFVASTLLRERETRRRRRIAGVLFVVANCGLLGCASSVQQNNSPQNSSVKLDEPGLIVKNDEGIPRIEYDERGRIKGLFGLRTHPTGDPTCKPVELTADYVNMERNEYLLFQIPSTFQVWVKVEGEMQEMFSDPKNAKAREFLSRWKKYRLKAYSCDGIGHTTYQTVSVELMN
jgi:hypothetical protein